MQVNLDVLNIHLPFLISSLKFYLFDALGPSFGGIGSTVINRKY